jgi:hypothetical protein
MLVLVVTGSHTRPPGPTTMDVDTPLISVVTVIVPVAVENSGNVVGV